MLSRGFADESDDQQHALRLRRSGVAMSSSIEDSEAALMRSSIEYDTDSDHSEAGADFNTSAPDADEPPTAAPAEDEATSPTMLSRATSWSAGLAKGVLQSPAGRLAWNGLQGAINIVHSSAAPAKVLEGLILEYVQQSFHTLPDGRTVPDLQVTWTVDGITVEGENIKLKPKLLDLFSQYFDILPTLSEEVDDFQKSLYRAPANGKRKKMHKPRKRVADLVDDVTNLEEAMYEDAEHKKSIPWDLVHVKKFHASLLNKKSQLTLTGVELVGHLDGWGAKDEVPQTPQHQQERVDHDEAAGAAAEDSSQSSWINSAVVAVRDHLLEFLSGAAIQMEIELRDVTVVLLPPENQPTVPFQGSAHLHIGRLKLHLESINFRDLIIYKHLDSLAVSLELSGFSLEVGDEKLIILKTCQSCGKRKATVGCTKSCCSACCPKLICQDTLYDQPDWRDVDTPLKSDRCPIHLKDRQAVKERPSEHSSRSHQHDRTTVRKLKPYQHVWECLANLSIRPAEKWQSAVSKEDPRKKMRDGVARDVVDCKINFQLVKSFIMVMVRFQSPFQIRCGRVGDMQRIFGINREQEGKNALSIYFTTMKVDWFKNTLNSDMDKARLEPYIGQMLTEQLCASTHCGSPCESYKSALTVDITGTFEALLLYSNIMHAVRYFKTNIPQPDGHTEQGSIVETMQKAHNMYEQYKPSGVKTRNMYDRIDTNHDGKLDNEELQAASSMLKKMASAIPCSVTVGKNGGQDDWNWSSSHGVEEMLRQVKLKKAVLEAGNFERSIDSQVSTYMPSPKKGRKILHLYGAEMHESYGKDPLKHQTRTKAYLNSYFEAQESDERGNVCLQFNLEEDYFVDSIELCNPHSAAGCRVKHWILKILIEKHPGDPQWVEAARYDGSQQEDPQWDDGSVPNLVREIPKELKQFKTQFAQLTLIRHDGQLGLWYVQIRGYAVDQDRKMALAIHGKAPQILVPEKFAMVNEPATESFIAALEAACAKVCVCKMDEEAVKETFELSSFLDTAQAHQWHLNRFVFDSIRLWFRMRTLGNMRNREEEPEEFKARAVYARVEGLLVTDVDMQRSLINGLKDYRREISISLGFLIFDQASTDALWKHLEHILESKGVSALSNKNVVSQFCQTAQENEWLVDNFAVEMVVARVSRECNEAERTNQRPDIKSCSLFSQRVHINLDSKEVRQKLQKSEYQAVKAFADTLQHGLTEEIDIEARMRATRHSDSGVLSDANMPDWKQVCKGWFEDKLQEIRASFFGSVCYHFIRHTKETEGLSDAQKAVDDLRAACLIGNVSIQPRREMRCIVLDLGAIRVDNHGTFYKQEETLTQEQRTLYNMSNIEARNKNRLKLAITATQCRDFDSLLSIQPARWQLPQERLSPQAYTAAVTTFVEYLHKRIKVHKCHKHHKQQCTMIAANCRLSCNNDSCRVFWGEVALRGWRFHESLSDIIREELQSKQESDREKFIAVIELWCRGGYLCLLHGSEHLNLGGRGVRGLIMELDKVNNDHLLKDNHSPKWESDHNIQTWKDEWGKFNPESYFEPHHQAPCVSSWLIDRLLRLTYEKEERETAETEYTLFSQLSHDGFISPEPPFDDSNFLTHHDKRVQSRRLKVLQDGKKKVASLVNCESGSTQMGASPTISVRCVQTWPVRLQAMVLPTTADLRVNALLLGETFEILQSLLAAVSKAPEKTEKHEQRTQIDLNGLDQGKEESNAGLDVAKLFSEFEGHVTIEFKTWLRLYYHTHFSAAIVIPGPFTMDKFNDGRIQVDFARLKIELPDRGLAGLSGEKHDIDSLKDLWTKVTCDCECVECLDHSKTEARGTSKDLRRADIKIDEGTSDWLGRAKSDGSKDDVTGSVRCTCPVLPTRPSGIRKMALKLILMIQEQLRLIEQKRQDATDAALWGTDQPCLRKQLAAAEQQAAFALFNFPIPLEHVKRNFASHENGGRLTYCSGLSVVPDPGQQLSVVPLLQMSRLGGCVNLQWNSWSRFQTTAVFIVEKEAPNQPSASHWIVKVNQPVTVYVFWKGPTSSEQEFRKLHIGWTPQEKSEFSTYRPYNIQESQSSVVLSHTYDSGQVLLEGHSEVSCEHHFAFIVPQQGRLLKLALPTVRLSLESTKATNIDMHHVEFALDMGLNYTSPWKIWLDMQELKVMGAISDEEVDNWVHLILDQQKGPFLTYDYANRYGDNINKLTIRLADENSLAKPEMHMAWTTKAFDAMMGATGAISQAFSDGGQSAAIQKKLSALLLLSAADQLKDLREMSLDDRASLLAVMPAPARYSALTAMEPHERAEAINQWPPGVAHKLEWDSIEQIMRLEVVALPNQHIQMVPYSKMNTDKQLDAYINREWAWGRFPSDSIFVIPEHLEAENPLALHKSMLRLSSSTGSTVKRWALTVNLPVIVYVFYQGPVHNTKTFHRWCDHWQAREYGSFSTYGPPRDHESTKWQTLEPDTIFAKSFETGVVELDFEDDEDHRFFALVIPQTTARSSWSVCGLDQVNLSLVNLIPSFGLLNRTGVLLGGAREYTSLDSYGMLGLKALYGVGMFILGLDTFPLGFTSFTYIYLTVTCDDEGEWMGGSKDCPNQSVALSHGLCALVGSIVVIPAVVHATLGTATRLFYVLGGVFTLLAFNFMEHKGLGSDFFTGGDTYRTQLISAAFWVLCAFYGALPLVINRGCWIDTSTSSWAMKLRSPGHERRNVLKSETVLFFLIGILQVLLISVEREFRDGVEGYNSDGSLQSLTDPLEEDAIDSPCSLAGWRPCLLAGIAFMAYGFLNFIQSSYQKIKAKRARTLVSTVLLAPCLICVCNWCSQTMRKQPVYSNTEDDEGCSKPFLNTLNTMYQNHTGFGWMWFLLAMCCSLLKATLVVLWIWTGFELDWVFNRGHARSSCMTHDITRMWLLMGWMGVCWIFALFFVVYAFNMLRPLFSNSYNGRCSCLQPQHKL